MKKTFVSRHGGMSYGLRYFENKKLAGAVAASALSTLCNQIPSPAPPRAISDPVLYGMKKPKAKDTSKATPEAPEGPGVQPKRRELTEEEMRER
jgi:hypothetical protein